jgi:cation:H+ antiporter
MAVLYLVVGLIILTFGAEVLVKGASRLALSFGVPSLVIGLTVVAYGTGAPELAVSARAAFTGESEIALGNVLGSNIANIWLVLGLCALVSPLAVHSQIVRKELPVMLGLSLLTYFLCLDGEFSRFNGMALISLLIAYTIATIKNGRAEGVSKERVSEESFSKGKESIRCIIGLVMLVGGADLFVDGAVEIARSLGISELVIGLTIVAIGTSMPEIMTSIVATYRGERDIAVGNVVGSNIFNLVGVLGFSAVVSPIKVPEAAVAFDMPVMILAALMCAPFFVGSVLTRWRGINFLICFFIYLFYLILSSTQDAALEGLEYFALYFFAPVVAVTVMAILFNGYKNNNLSFFKAKKD